jgi:hypothetical protein
MILEYLRDSQKIIINSFNKSFYKKLDYKREQLKNSRLRLLFPSPIAWKQKMNFLKKIETAEIQKFEYNLLFKDKQDNLKFSTYHIKTNVELNLKTYIFCEEKKGRAKNIEYFLLVELCGDISYSCKTFKSDFLLKGGASKYNIGDIFKYDFKELLSLCNETAAENYTVKSERLFQEHINISPCYIKIELKDEDIVYKGYKYYFISFHKMKNTTMQETNLPKGLSGHILVDDNDSSYLDPEDTQTGTILGSSNVSVSSNHFVLDENLASVILANNKLFTSISNKNSLLARQRVIYIVKALILLMGIGCLIYLNSILTNFSTNISNNLNSKTVENNIYNQLIKLSQIITIDGTISDETGLDYIGLDKYANTDLMYLFQILQKSLRKLDVFFSSEDNNSQFYKLYNVDQIQYVDFDLFTKTYIYRNSTFIDFLKLYAIHLNNLSNETNILTELKPTQAKNITDVSLFFVYQNLYPAINYYFTDINSNIMDSVSNTIYGITAEIVIYNAVYILIHLVLVAYVIGFLVYYKNRVYNIYSMFFNFGDLHMKYLYKKFKNLQKVVNLHLDLTKFKKNISDIKKQANYTEHLRNSVINKREKEKDQMRKFTNLPYIAYLTIFQFTKIIILKIFIYTIFSIIAIIVVISMLNSLGDFINYRYQIYSIQSNIYNSYLITKLALITDYSLLTVNWAPQLKFNDKQFYEDQFESYIAEVATQFDTLYEYQMILTVLQDAYSVYYGYKAEAICDKFVWNGYDLYVSYINVYGKDFLNLVIKDCKKLFKEQIDFRYLITHKFSNLRRILLSLRMDNSFENRIALINSDDMTDISNVFSFVRAYFRFWDVVYFRNILTLMQNDTYYFCLSIFIVGMISDIIMLYITKLTVLDKIIRDNKALITSLNLLKK